MSRLGVGELCSMIITFSCTDLLICVNYFTGSSTCDNLENDLVNIELTIYEVF